MTQEPNPRDPLTMGAFGCVNKLTMALGDLIRAGWPADELAAEYRKQQRAFMRCWHPTTYCQAEARIQTPSIDSIKKALRNKGTDPTAGPQLYDYRIEA